LTKTPRHVTVAVIGFLRNGRNALRGAHGKSDRACMEQLDMSLEGRVALNADRFSICGNKSFAGGANDVLSGGQRENEAAAHVGRDGNERSAQRHDADAADTAAQLVSDDAVEKSPSDGCVLYWRRHGARLTRACR
jgi:hypothetical protein